MNCPTCGMKFEEIGKDKFDELIFYCMRCGTYSICGDMYAPDLISYVRDVLATHAITPPYRQRLEAAVGK
jgi:hypothetical protein